MVYVKVVNGGKAWKQYVNSKPGKNTTLDVFLLQFKTSCVCYSQQSFFFSQKPAVSNFKCDIKL